MKKYFFILIFLIISNIIFSQIPKGKVFGRAEFDIGIEKVFVNEGSCEILIVLKNYGTAIPDNIFQEGKLKIVIEGNPNIASFFLKDIDKRGELNSKKFLNFNTGLILQKDEKLEVSLENINDKNKMNDRKKEFLKKDKCKEKTNFRTFRQETSSVFIEPVKNSNIQFGKYVPIKFKIPSEYAGRHIKGVFYFTEKSKGKKYFLCRQGYELWFDNLSGASICGNYYPNEGIIEVFDSYLRYLDERGRDLGDKLPIGEYLINADLYNSSNSLVKNYLGGPFRIIEIEYEPEPTQPTPSTSKPLIIQDIVFEDLDLYDKGVNIHLGIRGRTKDGSPVSRYCGTRVCGGEIKFFIYIIEPGPNYGQVFTTSYNIEPGRLKSDPNNPSAFGTYRDPLRITITFPFKSNYRIEVHLNLQNAEEKVSSTEILQGYGDFPSPGTGEIRTDTPPAYSTSPKENDILISGRNFSISWLKSQGISTTRLLYSQDNGRNWKKIGDFTGTSYNWTVPFEFTENGKIKFQWFSIKPEEGGTILLEESKNIKIRGILITSPKNEEVILPNSPYTITWNSPKLPNLKVKLTYGESTPSDVISCSEDDGLERWNVPNITNDRIALKAELLQNCNQNISYGEAIVERIIISKPYISFLDPQDGENLISGKSYTISYTPVAPKDFSQNGKVSIFYKFTNEENWKEIGSNLPISNYSVQWQTPLVTSTKYAKIKAVLSHPYGDVIQNFTSEINVTIKPAFDTTTREVR